MAGRPDLIATFWTRRRECSRGVKLHTSLLSGSTWITDVKERVRHCKKLPESSDPALTAVTLCASLLYEIQIGEMGKGRKMRTKQVKGIWAAEAERFSALGIFANRFDDVQISPMMQKAKNDVQLHLKD
nr:hypothetical protein Iba_scaffold9166CG0010 [Ipomoea batatas]